MRKGMLWFISFVVLCSAAITEAQTVFALRRDAVFVNEDGTGWEDLGLAGGVLGTPDACRAGTTLIVGARLLDRSVIVTSRVDGRWQPWRSLGGTLSSDVSLACLPDGTARVYARGENGAVFTRTTQANTAWSSIGGLIDGAPDAAIGDGGRIDVVVRGSDGAVWHNVHVADGWLGWQSLSVMTSASPAIARVAPDRLEVFTTAVDGAVQHGTLTAERTLTVSPLGGGVLIGSPDAGSNGDGTLAVAGRGTDEAIWTNTFNGSEWSGWRSLGDFRLIGEAAIIPRSQAGSGTPVVTDCTRRVADTPWGRQNPMEPGGTRRWNDTNSCVEGGALFPFRLADMEANEAITLTQWRHEPASASGQQTWGYDIGSMRLGTAADANGNYGWSPFREGTNGARNEDYLIYGQRVYAMTSGRVVKCWRNAQENDQPPALHPMRTVRRIAGSGNFVVIEEDDGDRLWYAHAQPGTIPEALCPINYTLMDQPNNETNLALQENQADVPADLQARVNAGDFLFLAGNSGQSSAPHLHIHKQRGPAAAPLPVAIGFSNAAFIRSVVSDIPFSQITWIRLNDEPFPPGFTALRPTR